MIKEDLEIYGIEYIESDDYKNRKKINKKQEKIRINFVKKFTREYIEKMDIDDYVEGKKEKTKKSFCKILEKDLDQLGRISGTSPADKKFGIYYSEEKKEYIYLPKKFGKCESEQEFFVKLKKELIKLIDAGEKHDFISLGKNQLSEMFKAKIYYVYNPNEALPIYSEKHLDFFLKALDIPIDNPKNNTFEKRKKILAWKNASSVFEKFSNLEFMNFLYSSYGFKQQIDILKQKSIIDKKNPKIIEDKDVIDRAIKKSTISNRKMNPEEINRKKTAIGIEAEEYVFEYEKKMNPKYSRKIKWVSKYSDTEGYDILSYDNNGRKKYIEVKYCSSGSLDKIDFYITANEKKNLDKEPNFLIYYIFGLRSDRPTIVILNNERLANVTFEPKVYKVIGKI